MPGPVFSEDFLLALRTLINVHHSIYPLIPPQGIYFEALVEQAFKRVRKPFAEIKGTPRNQPTHDLLVERSRISLKTETGAGTKLDRISITKLCTTEREPWLPEVLVARVMEHLRQYDEILMLRAIWQKPLIHYQLVDIPIRLLKHIGKTTIGVVGKRAGRQSIGADVHRGREKLFHVHFDGADGKCQIRSLDTKHCNILLEWDLEIHP